MDGHNFYKTSLNTTRTLLRLASAEDYLALLRAQLDVGQLGANEFAMFIALFPLLREKEAAQFLGFSVKALQAWRLRGSGPPFVRFEGGIRYRLGDLIQARNRVLVNSTSA